MPGVLGYLLMTLRWRLGANAWESLYSFGGGLSTGLALSGQFIGLSASAPEDQRATAISVYFLCQQIGIIIGVGSSTALVEAVFETNLKRRLQGLPSTDEVSRSLVNPLRAAFSLVQLMLRKLLRCLQFYMLTSRREDHQERTQ